LEQQVGAQNLIEIEQALTSTEEVRALVQELEEELSANYPPEQRHGLKLDAIFHPHIRFFVARLNGEPVACGGIALFEGFAELKRMYVRSDYRGLGVADSLIERLAEAALEGGIRLLRLETGTEQHAALKFYSRHGFQACEAFEPYASMSPNSISTSVFLEKQI
jgi:putative acetyltransferase